MKVGFYLNNQARYSQAVRHETGEKNKAHMTVKRMEQFGEVDGNLL